jgi:hypothetical protein
MGLTVAELSITDSRVVRHMSPSVRNVKQHGKIFFYLIYVFTMEFMFGVLLQNYKLSNLWVYVVNNSFFRAL